MNDRVNKFELPKNIEHYFATLSKLYGQDGKTQLQNIIVNAQIRIHEEWSSDNFNGGGYGHAIYLAVPDDLFLDVVKQKNDIQDQIKEDLNKIHNIQNEFIEEIFLELENKDSNNWRESSGLLRQSQTNIPTESLSRIWDEGLFRVFLSHQSQFKDQSAQLKAQLRRRGISCFVAHEDIHPTKEWQEEIESALFSMDALVALLSDDFHQSYWTDQEIGAAVGRRVPVVPVRLGQDPYGFIGKYQAIRSCKWDNVAGMASDIFQTLFKMEQFRTKIQESLVRALVNSDSWSNTKFLLQEVFSEITSISALQEDKIIKAYSENSQINGSFYARNSMPGLLTKLTGKNYVLHEQELIDASLGSEPEEEPF